jgi:hypothetical protein
MTAEQASQEALEEAVRELEELRVRLEWIAATFARLRADLQLTEGRIAGVAQRIGEAADNARHATESI